MRLGIALGIHGHRGDDAADAPPWADVLAQAQMAERAGFAVCAVDDAIVDAGMGTHGYWESFAVAGALAASTEQIAIAHSVVNPHLRAPAVVANGALTLQEICGGRYVLGVGAGNTPGDYTSFGIEAEPRFSRAAEAIRSIAGLVAGEHVQADGRFLRVDGRLAVPSGSPPPLVVAGRGPKMVQLAVDVADGWNGWSPEPQTFETFAALTRRVDEACERAGRDPATLPRSLDVAVDARELVGEPPSDLAPYVVAGRAGQVAEHLAAFGELGVEEVRCMLWPDPRPELRVPMIEALGEVIGLVR